MKKFVWLLENKIKCEEQSNLNEFKRKWLSLNRNYFEEKYIIAKPKSSSLSHLFEGKKYAHELPKARSCKFN